MQGPVVNVTFSPSLPDRPHPRTDACPCAFPVYSSGDKRGPFHLPSILQDQSDEWAHRLGPPLSWAFPQPSKAAPLQDGASQSMEFPRAPGNGSLRALG